jgi:RHS repeat-associated protein
VKKFGAQYAGSTEISGVNIQPYKYNGKELDRMHGLDTYDYGARQYNPITARWDRMDLLCEKYYSISPYAYCANNPVRYIDPDGREIWVHYYDEDGQQQSFQYTAGMRCNVDNSTAQTIVENLNTMYTNESGAKVIDAIIGSITKYGFMQADTHSEDGEGYLDPQTNIVSLNDVSNTFSFAEETFHMYQSVNNQGGTTAVNEVEAKLFSAKMYFEIDSWYSTTPYKDLFAGHPGSPYSSSMSELFYHGYNDKDYNIAVNSFFSGAFSGNDYKNKPGYRLGAIKKNPLIKSFLPVNK